MRHENCDVLELEGKEVSEFSPSKPREEWLRRRTRVQIRNMTANHRVNDGVSKENGVQVVTGRFVYDPLDMVALTGEKVDVHIMTQPPSGQWEHFGTELTNSSGRVRAVIPPNRRLAVGVYPVKMVVRGDHTSADAYLTVVPPGTEFVVFGIDGSFTASVSIMGSDPKVRAGAVDVVRFWQDRGYVIVYVTGRPDMQKQRVVAWLLKHNFPHGVMSFCDGLVHDPLRHKAHFLKTLISEFLPDGYASHLSQLESNQQPRPASTRSVLHTISSQPGGSGSRSSSGSPVPPGRTEQTLNQCRVEQDHSPERLSVVAGCWGRTGSTKESGQGLQGPKGGYPGPRQSPRAISQMSHCLLKLRNIDN